MKLIISSEKKTGEINDIISLSFSELMYNGTHLFIATNKWDEIQVEVADDMPSAELKYLHDIAPVKIINNPTPTKGILEALCVLFPNKAGALRLAFMKGVDIYGLVQ